MAGSVTMGGGGDFRIDGDYLVQGAGASEKRYDLTDAAELETATAVLAAYGLTIDKDGAIVPADTVGKVEGTGGSKETLGASEIEEVVLTPEKSAMAGGAAELMMLAIQECLNNGKTLAEISSDDLLAAFMKLNIMDKLKDPTVLDDLGELMKNCRKQANEREIALNAEQAEKQKEAMKKAEEAKNYASAMMPIMIVVIVILVIATIVAAVFTFGAGGVAGGAALLAVLGGMSAATASAIAVAAAIVAALMMIVMASINVTKAEKNYDAQMAFCEADKKGLDAKMMEKLREFFQENVEENQQLMQALMEAVNQFYQAVIKMVTAKGETGKLLLSATST